MISAIAAVYFGTDRCVVVGYAEGPWSWAADGAVELHEPNPEPGALARSVVRILARPTTKVDEANSLDHSSAIDIQARNHALVVHHDCSARCASLTVNRPS